MNKTPSQMNFLEFITQSSSPEVHEAILSDAFEFLSKNDMRLFYIFIEEFYPKIIEAYSLSKSNTILIEALKHCQYDVYEEALSGFKNSSAISMEFWNAFLSQFDEANIKKNKADIIDTIEVSRHSSYAALAVVGAFFDSLSETELDHGKKHYFDYAQKVLSKINFEKTLELINKNIDKDISSMPRFDQFFNVLHTLDKAAIFLSEEENEKLSIQYLKNFISLQKLVSSQEKQNFMSSLVYSKLNFWSPKVRAQCPRLKFDLIFEKTLSDYDTLRQLKASHIDFTKFMLEKIDSILSNEKNLQKPLAKAGFAYSTVNITKVQSSKLDYFNKMFSVKLSDHNSTNIMIERVAELIQDDIKKAQLIANFFNDEIHLYLKRNKFESQKKGLSAILQYCEKNVKKYKSVENIVEKYKNEIVHVEQQFLSEALLGTPTTISLSMNTGEALVSPRKFKI